MENFLAIIFPVIILTGLAVLFAIVIAFCNKKLAIKEDERVEQVLSLLAGANCGACGKAGCQDFAKALVEGKVDINACNATPITRKKEIIALLGSNAELADSTIVVVACNGGTNCQDKYEYQGYGGCASIEQLQGGKKSCHSGCIGEGDCHKNCPYDAIAVASEVAAVNQEKCTQCGACIAGCPKKIIKRIPASAKIYVACGNCDKGKDVRNVCSAGCIGCGLCSKNCPEGAITMVENLPVIDYSKCTGCFTCVAKCPTKVIKTLDNKE